MKYTITLYIIFCLLLLFALFMWERNTRLRKRLISQRKTNQYVLLHNRKLFQSVEAYKQVESNMTSIIEFQESVIREFAPKHSEQLPEIHFPLMSNEEAEALIFGRPENVKIGQSTLI